MVPARSVAGDLRATETFNLIAADKVEGTSVYNRGGEKLGTVENLMIDKLNGRVSYAVMSFGGFLGMGERLYAQRAYLAGVQVLDIRWAYPALTTSYLPPGTTLTFVFLDSFQGQVTIPDPGLEADTAVEFAGNSLVNGWSRGGSWRIASRATQSILGTATPIE